MLLAGVAEILDADQRRGKAEGMAARQVGATVSLATFLKRYHDSFACFRCMPALASRVVFDVCGKVTLQSASAPSS